MSEKPNLIVRLNYYAPDGGKTKYANRRAFYASDKADDYMRYIDKGVTGDKDYINYVGDSEKSAGVFGNDGFLSKEQKAELRKALRATDSVIWDMVVSFEAGYGDKNLRNPEAAQGLLNSQLNRFFKKAGLSPDNVTWFAGLHENTNNRHIHVCFFEKEPMLLRRGKEGKHYHQGKLRQTGIDSFKIGIEQYFSDATVQLKAQRQEIMAAAKTILSQPNLNYEKTLKRKIVELARHLPADGRLGYESENMENLRWWVDGITALILKNGKSMSQLYPSLKKRLKERDDEIRAVCRKQKIKNVDEYLLADKIIRDLYSRIGNKVIQAALNVWRQQDKQKRVAKAPVAKRRMARIDLLRSIEECVKLTAICDAEGTEAFLEYLERLEEAAPERFRERDEISM